MDFKQYIRGREFTEALNNSKKVTLYKDKNNGFYRIPLGEPQMDGGELWLKNKLVQYKDGALTYLQTHKNAPANLGPYDFGPCLMDDLEGPITVDVWKEIYP